MLTTTISCIASLATAAGFLGMGVTHLSDYEGNLPSLASLWTMGFGTVDVNSLVAFGSRGDQYDNSIMGMALLANLPQLVLSFLYLAYNGLWTCMLLGVEWNEFAFKRKGLRVTHPEGKQRGTYWLSLPKVRIFFSELGGT